MNTATNTETTNTHAAAPEGKKPIGIGDVVRIWNFNAPKRGCPATQRIDDQRGAAFRRMIRLEERLNKKEPWKTYFKAISKSPALNGNNPTQFKATLDWALCHKNYVRVMVNNEFPIPEKREH